MSPRFTLLYAPTFVLPTILALGGLTGERVASNESGTSGHSTIAAAREIDRILERDMRRDGLAPGAIIDDAAFVRRLYLSVAGRIPTLPETRAFLGTGNTSTGNTNKRRQLIDRLLSSPGHESHVFNWFADLLRVKSRLQGGLSGEPYIDWLKRAIRENRPYDEMVRQLLTASGAAHARGNGATGYYLRDRGMPEDNMSNTVRVFLGTRLECAQCHNHPFDKWKQTDFFGMAAFTGGINFRDNSYQAGKAGKKLRDLREIVTVAHGKEGTRALNRVLRPMSYGISGSGAALARLPHDYQYDDAKPNQPVKAETMFGEEVAIDVEVPSEKPNRRRRRNKGRRRNRNNFPAVGSRAKYADWMTSPRNPRFTKVIVNRMWKRAFGRGLIEPVDDIKDDSKPSNPELLAFLERLMVDIGYDLREFERVLYNTKAWQREACGEDIAADRKYHFSGPLLRRMTAEQMWDSMLTLAVEDIDAKLGASPRAEQIYERYDALRDTPFEAMLDRVDRELLRRTDPKAYRKLIAQERKKQAARRMAERNKMRERSRTAARKRGNRVRELRRQLKIARRKKDKRREREILAELRKVNARARRRPNRRSGGQVTRASNLSSPARPGHLLRQFGQSDREQIEASDDDANVPQVLTLLNGFVEQTIGRPGSVVMNTVEKARTNREKIRAAFLSILQREPTAQEIAMWQPDLEREPRVATSDLIWTLVNTHEFRFVR